MHTLHLLRHAKSSWNDDEDDHRRALAGRGREAARLIGDTLPVVVGKLDLVLCSTALRARETAELALRRYKPAPRVLYEESLYLANPDALIHRLRLVDEDNEAVMVVGHNPGLHELAIALAAPGSPGFSTLANGKFPTGVRASFALAGSWADIAGTRHKLVDYVTVKSLDGEE